MTAKGDRGPATERSTRGSERRPGRRVAESRRSNATETAGRLGDYDAVLIGELRHSHPGSKALIDQIVGGP
jgi:hypothetical protein